MKPVNSCVDIIIGQQTSAMDVETSLAITFSFERFFDNATEDLFFSPSVGLIAEASTAAVGLGLSTPLATGKGADVIIGVATATARVDAIASVALTGLIQALNKSNISSTVVASAFARAVANATAIGIDSTGLISTGSGNDLIVGEATANGIAEALANAAVDVVTQADGTGSLESFIFTNLLSTTEINATAIGIRGGHYDLGHGADTLIARAQGVGVNIGVQDVLINGGKGDDIFDLQSGTGEVIGGKGRDVLKLEGHLADYSFTALDMSLGVNIQNSLNHTHLLVSEVEQFQFAADAGLTYHYADLFLA